MPQHRRTAAIDRTDGYDTARRYGIYTRRIRPLWYLRSFTGETEDIFIAYGQGESVVNFMVRGLDPLPSPGEWKAGQRNPAESAAPGDAATEAARRNPGARCGARGGG